MLSTASFAADFCYVTAPVIKREEVTVEEASSLLSEVSLKICSDGLDIKDLREAVHLQG